ncbi:MAG: transposase [candidate division WOR-3 bacterium]
MLFPPQLDEWIPQNHPARVVDLFVDSLDMAALGIRENNQETGRPSYDPKLMMKLLLYGYSQGERSSRKLERLTYENTAYIWLTGNLHPDYRTIARFRQQNISVMRELLKKTLEFYQAVDVALAEVVFADGTKVFANASDDATITEEKIRGLEEVASRILKEAEDVDKDEDRRVGEKGIGTGICLSGRIGSSKGG